MARWDDSVQHFGWSGVRMDPSARLFLCARCAAQVVLCRRCDRGNRYCSRACGRQARVDSRRRSAQRYQRSPRGRRAHAQRTRRWRQRVAAVAAAVARGSLDANNVTHQGSQPAVASAPLAACRPPSLTVALADATTLPPAVTGAHTTIDGAAGAAVAAASPPRRAVTHAWRCARCGAWQPAAVRQGFVRHGTPMRWRHDHSP